MIVAVWQQNGGKLSSGTVSLKNGLTIGIDVGGTFTDVVAQADGVDICLKVPTTKCDQSIGVLNGLRQLATKYGIGLEELLSKADHIVHGSTVGTNAMLEFDGAHSYMLTNEGLRDIIDIRRNFRESAFDLRLKPPHPIIPRSRRIGINGRIDSSGAELTPLAEDDVVKAAERMRRDGVESVAVCYLFSFLNSSHELRTREILESILADVSVSLSHEVIPKIREFERFSTTAVDAYITPIMANYLRHLSDQLKSEGYSSGLSMMRSNGGITDLEKAAAHGVDLLFSGPAAGVVASAKIAEAADISNVITLDMGGTSCDVALLRNGKPTLGSETWVSRYKVSIPVIDISTIGAGGGSLAWVDEGGALRVGPESAGSQPGPACYGNGGTGATVTDADLVLGLLGEELGGSAMAVDTEAASKAIWENVAEPLGTSVIEAAKAIFEVVNQGMANAVRLVSLERAQDPRECAMMPFGGAGPLHAAAVARELGMSEILVPRHYAPVLCALGDAVSDIRETQLQSFLSRGSQLQIDDLVELFEKLNTNAAEDLPALASGLPNSVERSLEMRYHGQTHEVPVPILEEEWPLTSDTWQIVRSRFDVIHKEQYSFSRPDSDVEIIGLHLDRWAHRERSTGLIKMESGQNERKLRTASLPGTTESQEVAVYDGEFLKPGDSLAGPCFVDEPNTTIVVLDGQRIRANAEASYLIEEIS